MNKITISIRGMHCRSCEILIEEKLREIMGAKNVHVDLKKSEATIYSITTIPNEVIHKAIIDAGYYPGTNGPKTLFSKNLSDYTNLAISGLILLILYFIANKLGLLDISTSGNNPSNYFVILLIGLTAGFSTCMALVGGLILGLSARFSEMHPQSTSIQKFRPHLFFNIGRIGSYFILGGLIGLIGKSFQLSGPVLGTLTIGVGLVMLVLGLQLTEIFPRLSNGGLTLPSGISKLFGLKNKVKEYSHANSMLVGALTFFLPCGFTQAMQLYAMSTGSFLSGAIIMGIFALGTTPGLLGIGGLTSIIKGTFAKKCFKFVGAMVVLLAVFNISNGWNLTGWQGVRIQSNEISSNNDEGVKIENGYQIVKMAQNAYGYEPNKFTIKRDIPVKWIIDSKNSNSCSSSILMPKYNVRKYLIPGENIIEFTPKETGELKFTCTMGMYSGKFMVTENKSSGTPANNEIAIANNVNANTDTLIAKESNTKKIPENTNQTASRNSNTSIPKNSPQLPARDEAILDDTQVIKATFNEVPWEAASDISPYEFNVKAGNMVRFEILANADGLGCMSTIMIPGLADTPELLEKGKTIVFEFVPAEGTYDITCAMGVPRGKIIST